MWRQHAGLPQATLTPQTRHATTHTQHAATKQPHTRTQGDLAEVRAFAAKAKAADAAAAAAAAAAASAAGAAPSASASDANDAAATAAPFAAPAPAPAPAEEAAAAAQGGGEELLWWDVAFWAERLRESRYDLKDEELRPYFALPAVLEGLFQVRARARAPVCVRECGWRGRLGGRCWGAGARVSCRAPARAQRRPHAALHTPRLSAEASPSPLPSHAHARTRTPPHTHTHTTTTTTGREAPV
jgi:hypothetical protein